MPLRRIQKKMFKRRKTRKALKKTAPRLYKAVKAIAKTQAYKAQETKYVAQPYSTGSGLYASDITNQLISQVKIGDNNYLQPALPDLIGGYTSERIIGSKCHLVSGHTNFLFTLPYNSTPTRNITVVLFCLESRRIRSTDLCTNLPANDLLRKGTNLTCDWSPSSSPYTPLLAMLPANKLAYKVHHIKHFKLAKNAGTMNGDSSTPPPAPNNSRYASQHKFTWNWGRHMELKYDELPSDSNKFPTNFAPLWGVVAYYEDGTSLGDVGSPLPVSITATNHMYFKDA